MIKHYIVPIILTILIGAILIFILQACIPWYITLICVQLGLVTLVNIYYSLYQEKKYLEWLLKTTEGSIERSKEASVRIKTNDY